MQYSWLKPLVLVVLLPFLTTVAGAQYGSNQSILRELTQKVDDYNPPDKNLPSNELQLVDEDRQLSQELQQYGAYGQYGSSKTQADALKGVPQAQADAIAAVNLVKSTRWNDLVRFRKTQQAFNHANDEVNKLLSAISNGSGQDQLPDNPLQLISDINNQTLTSVDFDSVKGQINDAYLKNVMAYFSKLTDLLNGALALSKDIESKQQELIAAIKKRKEALASKLSGTKSRQSISENLWKVMLVIGGLSLLAIFSIRFFPEKVQMNWVESGQVIQFVTVMILLSVIMGLGLSGIIQENTLGTLLGGIAGYVLAQGVPRRQKKNSKSPVGE